PITTLEGNAHSILGRVLHDAGQLSEAEAMHRRALDLWQSMFLPGHRYVLSAKADLARLLADAGHDGEAETPLRGVLAARRHRPESSRGLASSLHDLGHFLAARNQLDEAELLLNDALRRRRKILWAENPDLARTLLALARVRQRRCDWEGAKRLASEASSILNKRLPSTHPLVTTASSELRNIQSSEPGP